MIDKAELLAALAEIEQDKKDVETLQQLQLKAESDARRITAIDYIKTLNLKLKGNTTSEQKTECYTLMDYLRNEQKMATYGELREELQKKIDELLIQANQLKDLQRLA